MTVTLLPPPNFRSPAPQSARFRYRSADGTLMVLATTGYAFIRMAWAEIRRTDLSSFQGSSDTLPWSYYPPLPSGHRIGDTTYGRPFSVSPHPENGMVRGTRWDNDFTRALWVWVYKQWQIHVQLTGEPLVSGQYYGDTTSPSRNAWIHALNVVLACETNQRV